MKDNKVTNLKSLISKVAEVNEISKTDSEIIVRSVITILLEEFQKGNSVKLGNFGTFKVYTTKKRNSRNPSAGIPIVVDPKRVVKFIPTGSTKETVKES